MFDIDFVKIDSISFKLDLSSLELDLSPKSIEVRFTTIKDRFNIIEVLSKFVEIQLEPLKLNPNLLQISLAARIVSRNPLAGLE